MVELVGKEPNAYQAATRELRKKFIYVGLFSAAVNILMLTGPLFMLQVYDRVLSSGSVPTLQGLFMIVVIMYFFLWFYDFLRTRMLSRAGYQMDKDIGAEAFEMWIKSGLGQIKVAGRPLNDLAVVRGFIGSPAILGFFDLPWMPFYLMIVFFVHPLLGFLALFGAVVVTVLALLNQYLTSEPLGIAMGMDANESSFVDQSHRNADAVVPLGMSGKLLGYWREMHNNGLATGQAGADYGELFSTISKAFRLLLQSSLLALGGYLVLKQEISPGMIIAASIIAGRALAPVDQVIGQWKTVVRAKDAHIRLKATFGANAAAKDYMELPDPTGALTVAGVIKYPPQPTGDDDKPILSNISFKLEPGEALGVIGPSACGKSTLARLIVGAWMPDVGEVRLDGAKLDQYAPDILGRHIGYLPQRMELLTGTVRDNIARFDPEAPDEDVVAAAKIAGVHDMILKLPDGYGTKISLGAATLSGGQIQRIGLARSLFGRPKLIVLDEPNSNLDAQGDEALTRAILEMRKAGSTVVVMAHRPAAISAVSKILVLQDGTVADYGDKDAVLGKMRQAQQQAQPQINPKRVSVAKVNS
jgi:ATP-binding cassette, subfamily C, type I secretion system permease/ATPase